MSLAHYILQVNIYLVIFYGFYKLLLDKETYFTLNRIYLASAGFFSLTIPFLRFEWFSTQPAAQSIYVGVDQVNQFVTDTIVTEQVSSNLSPGFFLVVIYLTGVLFFFSRFVYRLFSINKAIKEAKSGSAFSFFRKKIIDSELPNRMIIDKHEEIHVRQFHTVDVLFFEMLGILNWFNPIIYFYKNLVKNIHEYLADEEAAKFQGDKKEYALILLGTALGVSPNNITNQFYNKSLIKKRVFMLYKQRSAKTAVLKYGLFAPLFAMMLIFSSATVRNNENIQKFADEVQIEEPLTLAKNIIKEVIPNSLETIINQPDQAASTFKSTLSPSLNSNVKTSGDWNDFYKYFQLNIKYPANAIENEIQGNVQVKFRVNKGAVEEIGLLSKTIGSDLESEVINKILNYKKYTDVPEGKYIFTVTYKLEGSKSAILNENLAAAEGYVPLSKVTIVAYAGGDKATVSEDMKVYNFTSLDKNPEYPGGIQEFYTYVSKTIKYPKEALDKKTEGKVLLSFIVEKDGSITDIMVDRKLGNGTDEEAVRVIKESKKWNPGIVNGKQVRVKYNIPIGFSLNNPPIEGNIQGIQIRSNKLTLDNPKLLYIVDGEKQKVDKLATIKSEDIESIEILKDKAATEIYGADAKEGVIIITTKAKKAADVKNKGANEKKN